MIYNSDSSLRASGLGNAFYINCSYVDISANSCGDGGFAATCAFACAICSCAICSCAICSCAICSKYKSCDGGFAFLLMHWWMGNVC